MTLTANTWTKVATSVNDIYINKVNNLRTGDPTTRVYEYITATGGAAPTDLSAAVIWDTLRRHVDSADNVDVYLYPLVDMTIRIDTGDDSNQDTLSFSRDARVITNYADNYRVQGKNWVHQDTTTLGTGLNYFVFDPTPLVAQGLTCYALPLRFVAPEGPVTLTIYAETDYTGTTDMLSYNPELNGFIASTYTQYATLKSGATGTTKGTKLNSLVDGSASIGVNLGVAVDIDSLDPIIVDTSVKYLFELNNATGAELTGTTYLSWFEI